MMSNSQTLPKYLSSTSTYRWIISSVMSCEGRAFQSAVAPSNSPMAHLVVLLVDARNEKEGSVALVHDLLVSPLDEIAHLRRTPQHHRRDLADDPDLVPRAVGLVPLRAGTRKHTNRHARRRDGDRSARARARARARGGLRGGVGGSAGVVGSPWSVVSCLVGSQGAES